MDKIRREYDKIFLELETKKEENDILEEKYKKEISLLQIENSQLRKREDSLKNSILKFNNSIQKESNSNSFQNITPQFDNKSNLNTNEQLKSLNNNNYMSFNQRNINENNPKFENDESFKYSYYLIDNLKNAINGVDFQNEYSNLV